MKGEPHPALPVAVAYAEPYPAVQQAYPVVQQQPQQQPRALTTAYEVPSTAQAYPAYAQAYAVPQQHTTFAAPQPQMHTYVTTTHVMHTTTVVGDGTVCGCGCLRSGGGGRSMTGFET